MPQYLSPGVYVEEVPSAVKPIAGAGTSTAAFVGQVLDTVTMPAQPGKFVTDSLGHQVTDSMGKPIALAYTVAPAGAPQLITSWESFKKNFGDFQGGNLVLAHAVYGFFNNGGTRCWITRITGNVTDGSSVTAVTNALAGFRAIDEISIVAVPGAIDAASQAAVIAHCQNAGDRFAILDSQITSTLTPAAIQGSTGNSNYAAMYFPRIQVFDPVSNGSLYVAPSGHMAGIYARVDTQRGVHKAPANEVVLGAVGLEARLGKADQDGLNPAGINVIRNLNGNITVWGARTLGGDANLDWKYINVRRLFLFLRDSIDAGTQWVVFEPNDLSLWAKITRNVSAFLTNVWRSGALFGATAPEAFYVRCDATTNPPEVRDLGQVVTEIGVAVVKPAEFVIFRISQWAGPGK
ncbi:MAG TPA: phage tail sheath subtilisin-like domain-containing protein [Thermoanaerobaculia bacterium]|nr:phage tail sheath subtilisin-like domain-containing protein [Thermoanaerobaculia bacterium]